MFGPGHMATIILYAAQGEPMPVSPPPPPAPAELAAYGAGAGGKEPWLPRVRVWLWCVTLRLWKGGSRQCDTLHG